LQNGWLGFFAGCLHFVEVGFGTAHAVLGGGAGAVDGGLGGQVDGLDRGVGGGVDGVTGAVLGCLEAGGGDFFDGSAGARVVQRAEQKFVVVFFFFGLDASVFGPVEAWAFWRLALI
jgi:hypothetical protein